MGIELTDELVKRFVHSFRMRMDVEEVASKLGYSPFDTKAFCDIAVLTQNGIVPLPKKSLDELRTLLKKDSEIRSYFQEPFIKLVENPDYLNEMYETYQRKIKPIMFAKSPYHE